MFLSHLSLRGSPMNESTWSDSITPFADDEFEFGQPEPATVRRGEGGELAHTDSSDRNVNAH